VISIIAEFVVDIEEDQQTGSEAGGQSENVDQGEGFLPEQPARGNFQVFSCHGGFIGVMF